MSCLVLTSLSRVSAFFIILRKFLCRLVWPESHRSWLQEGKLWFLGTVCPCFRSRGHQDPGHPFCPRAASGFADLLFRADLGFSGVPDGKESTCIAGDPCLISGLRRSPGEGNGYHSCILAWKNPWKEEPGWLKPTGLQRVGRDWVANTFTFYV